MLALFLIKSIIKVLIKNSKYFQIAELKKGTVIMVMIICMSGRLVLLYNLTKHPFLIAYFPSMVGATVG